MYISIHELFDFDPLESFSHRNEIPNLEKNLYIDYGRTSIRYIDDQWNCMDDGWNAKSLIGNINRGF